MAKMKPRVFLRKRIADVWAEQKKSKSFFDIYSGIKELLKVNESAAIVVIDLISRLNEGKTSVTVSMGKISESTRLTPQTVLRAVARLVDKAYIETFRRGKGGVAYKYKLATLLAILKGKEPKKVKETSKPVRSEDDADNW